MNSLVWSNSEGPAPHLQFWQLSHQQDLTTVPESKTENLELPFHQDHIIYVNEWNQLCEELVNASSADASAEPASIRPLCSPSISLSRR